MKIFICVGSSCHLKGSREVIARIQELIRLYDPENRIELAASFCLGHCAEGVSMMIDQEPVYGVNAENVEAIFAEKVLTQLR